MVSKTLAFSGPAASRRAPRAGQRLAAAPRPLGAHRRTLLRASGPAMSSPRPPCVRLPAPGGPASGARRSGGAAPAPSRRSRPGRRENPSSHAPPPSLLLLLQRRAGPHDEPAAVGPEARLDARGHAVERRGRRERGRPTRTEGPAERRRRRRRRPGRGVAGHFRSFSLPASALRVVPLLLHAKPAREEDRVALSALPGSAENERTQQGPAAPFAGAASEIAPESSNETKRVNSLFFLSLVPFLSVLDLLALAPPPPRPRSGPSSPSVSLSLSPKSPSSCSPLSLSARPCCFSERKRETERERERERRKKVSSRVVIVGQQGERVEAKAFFLLVSFPSRGRKTRRTRNRPPKESQYLQVDPFFPCLF